jgi:hypothetical protein
MEWVVCEGDCGGTTVASTSVGVGGAGDTTSGGYGGYGECNGTWSAMGSQVLPACNPVECDYANDGDPCTTVGESCGWGDECSSTTKSCGADHTWTVTYQYTDCCYGDCGGYGDVSTSVTSGVGASGGYGGVGGGG